MIIDFHTHAFPSNLASRAISNKSAIAVIDGSYDGLIESMRASQVDISLVLPIATRVGMFPGLNNNALEVSNYKVLTSFGSVHPAEPQWDKQLEYCYEIGLKGVKLHPRFQDFILDDNHIIDYTKYAISLGLYVLFHVGQDPMRDTIDRANVDRAYNLVKAVDSSHLILAHLGGRKYPDEAYEKIAGTNCLLDTAMCNEDMPLDKMYRIMEKHGYDKVLFGTDSPWSDQKKAIEDMKSFKLNPDDYDKVMFKNAMKVLGLKDI